MTSNQKIYLDYAASTPVDPRVVKAMQPYFAEIYGNPHALHSFGQEASRAVFESKRVIGSAIGADYKELVFTGSATEANNLAIRGVLKAFSAERLAVSKNPKTLNAKPYYPRVIISAFEHESVLETCKDLEKEGVEVIYVPVNEDGFVDFRKLEAALNDRTVLVSIMYANNEVGTIQPIAEISKIIKAFRVERLAVSKNPKTLTAIPSTLYPLLHTDAVQALQYLDCDVNKLGVDLMTLSAHKIYGPKGIGALYARRAATKTLTAKPYMLSPVITGSGQEYGLRSGTDNVPYIVGFARAVDITMSMQKAEVKRVGELRDYFWQKISKYPKKIKVNGSMKHRLPNNLNIYFPGKSAQELLIRLDLAGLAVSPGAACSTRTSKASFVLEAMGFSEARASESLRFSLGRQTTKKDIDVSIDKIGLIVL